MEVLVDKYDLDKWRDLVYLLYGMVQEDEVKSYNFWRAKKLDERVKEAMASLEDYIMKSQ